MSKCVVKHELGYVVLVPTEVHEIKGYVEDVASWDVSYTDIKEDATVFSSFTDFLWLVIVDSNEYSEEKL